MGGRRSLLLMLVVIPLFLAIYLLLFLDLDGLHSRSALSTQYARSGQLYVHSLVKLQRTIHTLSSDLIQVARHRDLLLSLISENTSEGHKLNNDLGMLFWMQNYEEATGQQNLLSSVYHLGCNVVEAIQTVSEAQLCGSHAIVQRGFHGLQEIILVKPLELCPKGVNQHDPTCLLSIRTSFLTELLHLTQLQHPVLLRLVAVCVKPQVTRPTTSDLSEQSIPTTSYVLETGSKANITQFSLKTWKERLTMVQKVASLFHYLATSPMGSMTLSPLSTEALVAFPGSELKVSPVGRLVTSDSPCHEHKHCYIKGKDVGIKCQQSLCSGLVSRRVLADANQLIFQPILKTSPVSLSDKVAQLIRNISRYELTTGQLLDRLTSLGQTLPPGRALRPLGGDLVSLNKPMAEGEGRLSDIADEPENRAWPAGQDSYTYKKVIHADLPNRHDYPCPRSRASWGCVLTVQHQDQAFQRCSGDPQCQAFVVVPHHHKKGWYTMYLKTGYTDPGKAVGSVLYIKQLVGGPDVDLIDRLPGKTEHAGEVETPTFHLKPCLDDVLHLQKDIRARREKHLMDSLGFTGVSEDQWRMTAKHSKLTSVTPGDDMSAKGQGHVIILMSSTQVQKATFLAAEGPELFHLAQLAFYHLDRLLGLYRTAPSVLRHLDKSEVQFLEKHTESFSQTFGPLLDIDRQLKGLVSMLPPSDVSFINKLDIVKLVNLTNKVISLTSQQQNQLEYLMLLWLTGTPQVHRTLISSSGELVHFMTWDAFHQGVDELLLYFHHCQFPRHTLELLWALQEEADDHCTLASQLLYELHLDGVTPSNLRLHFRSAHQVVLLVNRAAEKLLQVVDQCVARFGENAVFYDSR